MALRNQSKCPRFGSNLLKIVGVGDRLQNLERARSWCSQCDGFDAFDGSSGSSGSSGCDGFDGFDGLVASSGVDCSGTDDGAACLVDFGSTKNRLCE